MPERIAVYPGSFDPPTLGHLDLIERAVNIFDHVIVAVAVNDAKVGLFSVEERVEMLTEMVAGIPRVSIDHFKSLTVQFAQKKGAVALIRGLRVVSDFEFELTMAINNHKLAPEIDTVNLMPSEPYLFLSSRLVKEIAAFGGSLSHFVSPAVEKRLKEKLEEERKA
ncbi:MAG: pantetheine-phosphate adenylyltransferase [Candidatus Hydrogenedentes bacterium]|nr:pantetheine-phosphate adenylyltransferase [Candidatus Hydrogenedentota bacterium]